MTKNPFKVDELKSFRIFRYPTKKEKGLAIVKVISLDKELCRQIQKVRSRYLVATAELYYNNGNNIKDIIRFAKSFDFHIVSCERIKKLIESGCPGTKCIIIGAGEYLTSPNIFKLENYGERKTTFMSSANSFWKVKNHMRMLEIQKYLLDNGISTTSKIICGTIKDRDYYDQCKNYIKKNLNNQSEIIIGSKIEDLIKFYNDTKFLMHSSEIDSSPRVIFESMLCGGRCIVEGKWIESLNEWLLSPLIFNLKKTQDILDIVNSKPDLSINEKCSKSIGLINLKHKIIDFCSKEIGANVPDDGFVDYSIVGKSTFLGKEDTYSSEINILRKIIK